MPTQLEIEMSSRSSAFQIVEIGADRDDLPDLIQAANEWVREHDGDIVVLRLS